MNGYDWPTRTPGVDEQFQLAAVARLFGEWKVARAAFVHAILAARELGVPFALIAESIGYTDAGVRQLVKRSLLTLENS